MINVISKYWYWIILKINFLENEESVLALVELLSWTQ